ncbi:TRAP transporter small permease subunit [Pontibacterium sp. N1Y112]|uniref:TRAP transporter small permease protein n=1 Tax=Pontibacterium sinense TaxID=2781979 RepID=A0A8J7FN68_9GAMM|nr:TRAP transporter small permease subunit [Pontibacterium sinense]MBE9397467.1 TRAP transporter small permease subunit [Pontibacterium sinense]
MKMFFERADHYLAVACRFCLVFLTLFLTTMMAAAVFLRYVMDQSFPAIEELSILVGLWLYFIAMVVVTRERGHLTGGILDLLNLSTRTRALIKGFNDLVGLLVICFFGYYAFKYLFFVMKINRVSTNLSWPTALWVYSAIAGFTLMAIYKLRDLFIHKNSYTIYDNKSPHSKDAVLEEVSR